MKGHTLSDRYLTFEDGHTLALEEVGGMAPSVHVFDEDSILAVNAALATGRPLLVRGEPGPGKSQLARAAAQGLKRVFFAHAVDARTETRDLLWSVDTVARLAEAQMMGALKSTTPHDRDRINVREFVQPGPLWWAFDWTSALTQASRVHMSPPATPAGWTQECGVVVLVDEVDKVDSAVPNGLLDALGHGRFDVLGLETVSLHTGRPPLVIFTTNEERALPDAFLRRCLVLHLGLSEDPIELQHELVGRGRAHFAEAKCCDAVLKECAELLAKDRKFYRDQDLVAPGLAEYLDLVRAVIEQREGEEEQIKLLRKIKKFAFKKHPPESGQ